MFGSWTIKKFSVTAAIGAVLGIGLSEYSKPVAFSMLGRNSCGLLKAYADIGRSPGDEAPRIRAQSALLEETSDGLQRWKTPLGEFWNPKGNALFFALAEETQQNYGRGSYRVRPGSIVLDCGANIGDFVREALSAGAKMVVAIEPVPRNVACLRRTFATEIAIGSVIVAPEAVWNEPGTLKMALHKNSLRDGLVAVLPPEQSEGEAYLGVPLVTIDSLAARLALPSVDFIKMDIEGAEPKALAGARQTIASFRPQMAIATEHSPGEYAEVMKVIRETGVPYRESCGKCILERSQAYPETIFLTPHSH